MKMAGSEVVRSLGDVWVLVGGVSRGGAATTSCRSASTPRRSLVGTFIGSMMVNLWVYDGALDSTGTKLVLDSEGPSFSGDGTMAKYRDTIEIKDSNNRALMRASSAPTGSGSSS